MSELKCPFCQQELVREGSDNYWCKRCNLERHNPALYGSQKLWQELIRTRKALEIAKEGLKEIQDKGEYVNPIELADSYLDEITALEQKDVK